MTEPVLLSYEQHGKLRLSEPRDFTQYKSRNFVPIVFQEFYGLATEFPLVFVRNSHTADFIPVAMMGLNKGTNLYCQTPRWQPAFVPTSFTLTPLSVVKLQADSDEAVIAIDEQSPLLSDSIGEPLFQSNGQRTLYLQKRIDHVVTITRQSLQAVALCQYLADKRLFKSRSLSLQNTTTSPRYEVEGIFIIDEEVLENLSDEQFLELRRRQLLPLIYSHLTSLQQVGRLVRLQEQADKSD